MCIDKSKRLEKLHDSLWMTLKEQFTSEKNLLGKKVKDICWDGGIDQWPEMTQQPAHDGCLNLYHAGIYSYRIAVNFIGNFVT